MAKITRTKSAVDAARLPGVIGCCIIPIMGRMTVQDVKRPDAAALMKKLAYKQAEANRAFGVLRKMFNLAEGWGLRLDGMNPERKKPIGCFRWRPPLLPAVAQRPGPASDAW